MYEIPPRCDYRMLSKLCLKLTDYRNDSYFDVCMGCTPSKYHRDNVRFKHSSLYTHQAGIPNIWRAVFSFPLGHLTVEAWSRVRRSVVLSVIRLIYSYCTVHTTKYAVYVLSRAKHAHGESSVVCCGSTLFMQRYGEDIGSCSSGCTGWVWHSSTLGSMRSDLFEVRMTGCRR